MISAKRMNRQNTELIQDSTRITLKTTNEKETDQHDDSKPFKYPEFKVEDVQLFESIEASVSNLGY